MGTPRIIYWTTSCLEPDIEAISKEIFILANNFRPSLIFGVSYHYLFKFSLKHRYIGFNPKFYPFLRLLVPVLEQWADINHVYGEISPWLYHKALRKKPIVLTIASEKGLPVKEFLDRCCAIVVQTQKMKEELIGLGVDQNKVHLVYPGIDLQKFRPTDFPPPLNRPKILFATAPRSKEELEGRGVNFLIEVAKANPDIHFHFLYRPWANGYTSLEATRCLIEENGIKNVILFNEYVADMSKLYQSHHFTILPYTRMDGGKECPNSLIESLACGVPVLISRCSSLAPFVEKNGCGVVFDLDPVSLASAVRIGMNDYWGLQKNARETAKNNFNSKYLLKLYRKVYEHYVTNLE